MQMRDRVHQLIDELPDDEQPPIERWLHQRQADAGPQSPAITDAPADDEPLSPDDTAALEEGLADLAAGRAVSHEEARSRLFGDT